jgi:hypothetical protein
MLLLTLAASPAPSGPALSLLEALQLLALGLLVVVAVSQHRLSARLDSLERRLARPAAAPPVAPTDTPLPTRTVVILAAAAMEACEEPVRIIAIREAAPPSAPAWSLEGRRHIFASHTTR